MVISANTSKKITLMSLLASVMVVFIHVPNGYVGSAVSVALRRMILECVCEIAVPFFFVVSGYMIARRSDEDFWWKRAMGKRTRTVLIPFVLWCLISTVATAALFVIVNLLAHAPIERNVMTLLNLAQFGLDPMRDPPQPFWYLRTLLLFVLLSPAASWIIDRGKGIAVFALVLLMSVHLLFKVNMGMLPGCNRLFGHFLSCYHFSFFAFGFFLHRYSVSVDRAGRYAILLLAVTAVSLQAYMIFGGLTIGKACHVVFCCTSVVLVLSAFWLWLPVIALPGWLAGLPFPLYVTHDVVLDYLKVAAGMLYPEWNASAVAFFLMGLTCVLVTGVLVYGMRILFPMASKVLFGGR